MEKLYIPYGYLSTLKKHFPPKMIFAAAVGARRFARIYKGSLSEKGAFGDQKDLEPPETVMHCAVR